MGDSLYQYDDVGREKNTRHRDGSGTTLAESTYTYDLAGRVTSEKFNGASTSVGYDASDEVTSFGAEGYGFDGSGNRNTAGYSVGAGNRVSTDGVWTYTYDAEGQRTKKSKGASAETWTFGYDTRGQMLWAEKRATDGGTLQFRQEFGYDAQGDRVRTTAFDGTTTVTYRTAFGPDGEAWADVDTGNALIDQYVRAPGEELPVARRNALGASAWLHGDRLSSLRLVTDGSGAQKDLISYTAFGKVASESDASWGGRFKWTAQEAEAVLGQQRHGWRWYDLETGSWTSRDPIGFSAGDYNLTRYVGNNSVNVTDPSGQDFVEVNPTGVWWVIQQQGIFWNSSWRHVRIGELNERNEVDLDPYYGGTKHGLVSVKLDKLKTFANNFWNEYPDISALSPLVQDSYLRNALERVAYYKQDIKTTSATFRVFDAAREGANNGGLVMTDQLTFGLISPLHAQSERLLAEEPGVYGGSKVAGKVLRSTLISMATAGIGQWASGAQAADLLGKGVTGLQVANHTGGVVVGGFKGYFQNSVTGQGDGYDRTAATLEGMLHGGIDPTSTYITTASSVGGYYVARGLGASQQDAVLAMRVSDLFGGLVASGVHGGMAQDATGKMAGANGAINALMINGGATGLGLALGVGLDMDPLETAGYAQTLTNLGLAVRAGFSRGKNPQHQQQQVAKGLRERAAAAAGAGQRKLARELGRAALEVEAHGVEAGKNLLDRRLAPPRAPQRAAPNPAPTQEGNQPAPLLGPAQNGRFPLRTNGPSCFVAGTPILTPDGPRPVESLRPGDLVLSRSEHDPEGPVEARRIAENYVRVALLWEVAVGGQTVRTTGEHPFYVAGRGWVEAAFLKAGDRLVSHTGTEHLVEGVAETREVATVYNAQVEEFHTYFVGCQEWGFSVWAHNAEANAYAVGNVIRVVNKRLTQKLPIPENTAANEIIQAVNKGDRDGVIKLLKQHVSGLKEAEAGTIADRLAKQTIGTNGTLNPADASILFRETELKAAKIPQTFDPALSAKEPIRVVVHDGRKYLMQGSHRVTGAKMGKVPEVDVVYYTPEQWAEFVGQPFKPGGVSVPTIK